MRFVDIMLTLPELPLLLILSSSLRENVALQNFVGSNLSVVIIIFVLVFFGWMGVARLVRGSVLSLRSHEFIEASRALGSTNSRIIFRHLVPNSMAPIIVAATLGFGAVIIAESALSFLGFGVMPPVPTWGIMLNEARNSPLEYLFVQALSPGFMIFIRAIQPHGGVMPIRKFRSVEDMSQAPLPPLDPRNLKLVCDLSTVAIRIRPVRVPAGVYKYRSLEDAQHQRHVWGAW